MVYTSCLRPRQDWLKKKLRLMDLMSHLAQLSAYMVDKRLCTEKVGLDYIYNSSALGLEKSLEEKIIRVEV